MVTFVLIMASILAKDFEQCRAIGVYFASDETLITRFLTEEFPGFDLFRVLHELESVAFKWGFEWGTRQVSVGGLGGLLIHHQYDALEAINQQSLILKRTLKKLSPGAGRRVSHEELFLPTAFQNRGLSRELIWPYYAQYKAAGVDRIDARAGATGGGYALAKYGFAATNQNEVLTILTQGLARGIDPEAISDLRDQVEDFYRANAATSLFPIWEWARTPFSKLLLRETNWLAALDMHNPAQRATFEAYLYTRK